MHVGVRFPNLPGSDFLIHTISLEPKNVAQSSKQEIDFASKGAILVLAVIKTAFTPLCSSRAPMLVLGAISSLSRVTKQVEVN